MVVSETEGRERWIISDLLGFPPAADALSIVQVLTKLARYERHAAQQERSPAIELASIDEPPSCLVELFKRRGHSVTVRPEPRRAARGRASEFGLDDEGWPDMDALQVANASAFARAYGMPLPPSHDALVMLDEVLAERRRDQGLDADESDEDFLDGDLVVLAGAYAGESIRAAIGGDWSFDLRASMMHPVYLSVSDGSSVNVLGKVLKYLRNGPEDSVESLADSVVRQARDG